MPADYQEQRIFRVAYCVPAEALGEARTKMKTDLQKLSHTSLAALVWHDNLVGNPNTTRSTADRV
jgi:hypothetical protein